MEARNGGLLFLVWVLGIHSLITFGQAKQVGNNSSLVMPRTWDEKALASVELPLASTGVPPDHISSDYYYRCRSVPFTKAI